MAATKTRPATGAARPLAGATLVLTRPSGTARALAAQVRVRGGEVVSLPGLGLHTLRDPITLARLRAGDCDDWIFTSPAAVRALFELLPQWRLPRRARAFAVGTGTARALARRGVAALAPAAGADSDALLALPALAALHGRQVALITAPGGRNLIAPALAARGARVERLHVYARQAPRLTRRHHAALAGAPTPWLTLLSSAEALTHLLVLLPAPLVVRWRGQPLIVASERLAVLARAQGFARVVVAASALGGDLLAAAEQWLARARR